MDLLFYPEFIELLPLWLVTAGALGLLFHEAMLRESGRALSASVSVVFALAACAAAVWRLLEIGPGRIRLFEGTVLFDEFAAGMQLVSAVSALVAILFSARYLRDERAVTGEYYALIFLAAAGMMTMALAAELLTLFIGVELASLAAYVLAGYFRVREASLEAALKYYLPGIFAAGLLLFGSAAAFGAAGDTFYASIRLAAGKPGTQGLLALAGALLLAGFSFKAALAPFHAWAPDVYDGAAAPVSSFLATGIKAAVFAALARLFAEVFDAVPWRTAFIGLALLTMTVGNLGALMQKSVKRMLAFSSVAHAGYILTAFVVVDLVPTYNFYHGLFFYLLAYTLITGGAFGILAWAAREGETGLDLDDLAGIGRRFPYMGLAMAVFMFSLAGFPPTAGFFGKYFVFKLVVDGGYPWLAVLGVLNSFLAAYYYIRVVAVFYMRGEPAGAAERNAPAFAYSLAALGCTVGALVLGFLRLY